MKKYAILDGNNLAQIAFHRSKSILLKDKISARAKEDGIAEKEAKALTIFEADDMLSIENMSYLVFFRKLHKLYKDFKDHSFIMTWDSAGSSAWRRAIYPQYKSNRDYTSDDSWNVFFEFRDKLIEVLEYYPIHQMKIDNLEADDIMYEMSKLITARGDKVVVISGDSDMIQIAQEFGAKLFHPIQHKYVKPPKTYDYCIYKAIKGDKSDTIEGLRGYGEKRATRLAEELFGEDFIDDLSTDELTKEQQDHVLRNLKIIRISNNPNLHQVKLDLDHIDSDSGVDLNKIKKFFFDHKQKTLLESFEAVANIFS